MRRDWMVGLMAAGAAIVATLTTQAVTGPNRAQIEAIVRDYILANPEIIPQAVERLQQKQQASAIESNRRAIETPFAGAWEGARDGDVTVVAFMDYACGYCRASLPDLARLLREDARVRVVYREFPVLSEGSDAAARLALAAARAGKYGEVHRALYAAGNPTEATVAAIARRFALPSGAGDVGIDGEINANQALGRALQISGTPAFIIGNQMLAGHAGFDAMKKAVDAARAR